MSKQYYPQKIDYIENSNKEESEHPGFLREEDESILLSNGEFSNPYTDYTSADEGILKHSMYLHSKDIKAVRGFFNYDYENKKQYTPAEKSGESLQVAGEFNDLSSISFFGAPHKSYGIDISFLKKGFADKEFFLFYGAKKTTENHEGFFMQIYLEDRKWHNLFMSFGFKVFDEIKLKFHVGDILGLYKNAHMGMTRWKMLDREKDIENLKSLDKLPDSISSQEEVTPYYNEVSLDFLKDNEYVELLDQETIQAREDLYHATAKVNKLKDAAEQAESQKKSYESTTLKNNKLAVLWDNDFKKKCEVFNSYVYKSEFDFDMGGAFTRPSTNYPSDNISVTIWINSSLSNGESPEPLISPYYKIHGRINASYSEIAFEFSKEKYNGDLDYEAYESFNDLDSLLLAMRNYLISLEDELKKQELKLKK